MSIISSLSLIVFRQGQERARWVKNHFAENKRRGSLSEHHMKTTPAPFAILMALLTGICACAAAVICPAPARAQAARIDTPTNVGGRRITTSGTVPRMDTGTGTDASAPKSSEAGASSARPSITSSFKYQPPPPPKTEAEEDEVDLRDIDKPKNEIIRLPRMTVTAKKPPVFTDRTLYTQDQLRALAMSRYLGALDKKFLNKWTFADIGLSIGATNADRAMQMYLDDERLQNMSDAQQQISTAQAAGKTDEARQMKSQYYDMFLRAPNGMNSPLVSPLKPRAE